jgi:hypothetical protein
MAIWFVGVTAAGLLLWAMLDRRTIRRWAKSRPPTTWDQLKAELLRAGASAQTADFVCKEFAPHYRYGLTPYPEDQLFSTLGTDPGDVEDAVEQYWKIRGWELPSPTEPKLVPGDPTLLEFALWLEHAGYPPESP